MDEDIAVPLIVFSFILAIVWTVVSHSRWKYKQKQEAGRQDGNSLRTSELKDLMREAVEEANAPLAARVELLEVMLRDLATPRLNAADEAERLNLPDVSEDDKVPMGRRRVTDT